MGDEGKPPIQMALPQAGLHAGAEASVASLIAHYARQTDGLGQHVVVEYAGLHRVDPDERAGDADSARQYIEPLRHVRSDRSACGAKWFSLQGRLHLERHRGGADRRRNLMDWVLEGGIRRGLDERKGLETWTPGSS